MLWIDALVLLTVYDIRGIFPKCPFSFDQTAELSRFMSHTGIMKTIPSSDDSLGWIFFWSFPVFYSVFPFFCVRLSLLPSNYVAWFNEVTNHLKVQVGLGCSEW